MLSNVADAYIGCDGKWRSLVHALRHPVAELALDPHEPPTRVPGLPRSFFGTPEGGATTIDTLETAMRIARTGVFLAGSEAVRIERLAAAGDSVALWLDTAPFDSTLMAPAEITMFMELVSAQSDSVLWRGDTITARGIVGQQHRDTEEVPAHLVTTPNMEVYIRLRSTISDGLAYAMSAGFDFVEDSTLVGSGAKRMRELVGSERAASDRSSGALHAAVIPNPLKSGGELRVTVPEAGTLRVSVHDMLGEEVVALSPIQIDRPGMYAVPLESQGLAPGNYLVRVDLNGHVGATRFSVVR